MKEQTNVQVLVKSRFLGSWEERDISLNYEQNTLTFKKASEQKTFPLSHIRHQIKENSLQIYPQNGRVYQIKNTQSQKQISNLALALSKYAQFQKIINFKEMKVPTPLKVNYFAPIHSHQNSYICQQKKYRKSISDYNRISSYIKESDWQRDKTRGGLRFTNDQKRSNHTKIITFVCKKVLSTGSFMGISFPVFAMKPESMLQTYSKCLGVAPIIFQNISDDPVQRIKAFNAFICTFSLLFIDTDKPFNPCIGQTFQAKVAGFQIFAQQISHHPPISSLLLVGDNYTIHASLQLDASLSINSAVGIFYGEVVVQFDDGGIIKGKIPSGIMTGIILGDILFHPKGASYSYDPINQIVSSYEVIQKDIMTGCIGKLKPKAHSDFMKMMETNREKFQSFKHFHQKKFETIMGTMELTWTKRIKYDGQVYVDYEDQKWLPIELDKSTENKLESDSIQRPDIPLLRQNKIDEAQQKKQEIEEEERRLRKLRQKNKKK